MRPKKLDNAYQHLSHLDQTSILTNRSLGLSASRPIRVSIDTITQANELGYDMHYGVELGIVLSGRIERIYPNWKVELAPGEPWYCGILEPHGWLAIEAPCKVLVMVILPEILAQPEFVKGIDLDWLAPFHVSPEYRPRTDFEARKQLLAIAQQMCVKLDSRSPFKRAWFRLLTFEILHILHQRWDGLTNLPVISHSYGDISPAVELVLGAKRLITAGEAAKACAMSGRTFRRAFEGVMGVSFSKFALRYRLNGVADDLINTDNPLKVIAAKWGFFDASHLHHCFLQHYRCSPDSYRKQANIVKRLDAPTTYERKRARR